PEDVPAEVDRVLAERLADDADVGRVGPRAAVRAAGHVDRDAFLRQTVFRDAGLDGVNHVVNDAFRLGDGQSAGRQRDAGHRVPPQQREFFRQWNLVLAEDRVDLGLRIWRNVAQQ